jgi:leader peptidase (prepilin peptidase)/N-methyltransferase
MEIMWMVFFALLGMTIGSFMNVCIDRLPSHKSLVFPASHCTSCQRRLSVKELIPVFSYIWLRGRCRYCQAPIPRRLLWVEIGTGAIFAFLYWHYGFSIELGVVAFYFCLLLVILVIDFEHHLILNKVVYPGIVIASAISLFLPDLNIAPGIAISMYFPQLGVMTGIASAAAGGAVGLGVFLLITIISRGGMGWGDVKMAALIGLVTGFPLIFIALLLAVILGGLVAWVLILLRLKSRKQSIPFGPFLSLATMATLLWGSDILNWYIGFF